MSLLNFQCDPIIFLRLILIPLLHLKIFVLSGVENEVMRAAGKFLNILTEHIVSQGNKPYAVMFLMRA